MAMGMGWWLWLRWGLVAEDKGVSADPRSSTAAPQRKIREGPGEGGGEEGGARKEEEEEEEEQERKSPQRKTLELEPKLEPELYEKD